MLGHTRGRQCLRWLALVVVILVTVACTRGSKAPERPPPAPAGPITLPTIPPVASTLPASASLGLGPGEATLRGTVVGVDGPVPGAVVHVERLAGDAVVAADVQATDGSWLVESVVGGSYRIRAHRPPDFAQEQPITFFLGATEAKTIDLRVTKYEPDRLAVVVAPNPPTVDQPATMSLQVSLSRVESDGRQIVLPRQGLSVQITVNEALLLESPPQVATDASGTALWRVRCRAPGPVVVALVIGAATTQVNFPPCASPTTTVAPVQAPATTVAPVLVQVGGGLGR